MLINHINRLTKGRGNEDQYFMTYWVH